MVMKRIKQQLDEWSLFQQVVTVLLTTCTILLAAYVGLAWFYLSAMTRDVAVLGANQAEAGRTFMIIRDAQDALGSDLSSTLNAIRKELSLLNEKASKSEEVIPPSRGAIQ
jgi:Tfp pilus assembly protein PilO